MSYVNNSTKYLKKNPISQITDYLHILNLFPLGNDSDILSPCCYHYVIIIPNYLSFAYDCSHILVVFMAAIHEGSSLLS